MTRSTCVCWSMTSETSTSYGSRVLRQGRSRRFVANHASRTERTNRIFTPLSVGFGWESVVVRAMGQSIGTSATKAAGSVPGRFCRSDQLRLNRALDLFDIGPIRHQLHEVPPNLNGLLGRRGRAGLHIGTGTVREDDCRRAEHPVVGTTVLIVLGDTAPQIRIGKISLEPGRVETNALGDVEHGRTLDADRRIVERLEPAEVEALE